MAARSFQITLAAGAQRLSDVYGDGVGVIHAAHDLPYRQILFWAETADAFIGSAPSVTSTTYGIRVVAGAAGVLPVSIGPYEAGPLRLSDFYAAGTNVLHILAIPY